MDSGRRTMFLAVLALLLLGTHSLPETESYTRETNQRTNQLNGVNEFKSENDFKGVREYKGVNEYEGVNEFKGASEYKGVNEVNPRKSSQRLQTVKFETYDVHMMLGDVDATVKRESAVCKPTTGMCANAQLSCPAACVASYVDAYGGGGRSFSRIYGRRYGGRRYRSGYRYGGRRSGGYGGSQYDSQGYESRNYGASRNRGTGENGVSGAWPSACKYECTKSCRATCST